MESLGFVLRTVLRNHSTMSCSKSLLENLRHVFIATFEDFEPSVSDAANEHILIPIVKLEDTEGCLYDTNKRQGLLSAVVSSLSKYIDRVFEKTTTRNDKLTTISPLLSLQRILRAISSLISPLCESILRGRFSPQAARAALKRKKKENNADDSSGIEVLNAVLSDVTAVAQMESGLQWPALKFMCSRFVPDILEQFSRARLDTRDGKQIKGLVLNAVEKLCQSFGELFTEVIVRPLFLISMGFEMKDVKPPSTSFLRIMGRDVDQEAWWLDATSSLRKRYSRESLSRTTLFERLGPIYTQSVCVGLSMFFVNVRFSRHTHTHINSGTCFHEVETR